MRLSPWGRVVAISALLVVGGAVALAVGAFASSEPRVVIYPVKGAVAGVTLDVGDGDVTVIGGGRRDSVEVQRSERYSFGHRPEVEPRVEGATFRVRARCPATLLGPCTVDHRVVVPDNVALDIRTSGGRVSLRGYRGSARILTGSGAIDISGYCGNSLDARAGGGDITVEAACAPPRLSLAFRLGLDPRRASGRPLRPRRREHVRQRERARVDAARGRALHRAGAERVGRRLRGGPVVIAALELDRRLVRAGHAVAYLVTTLPVTLLAIPAVVLLILGAALSVAGIGLPLLLAAAAACRRLVRLGPRRGQPLAGCAGAADPEPRARDGQLVPAVARPAVRPRAVADGDASGAAAGAGRGAGRGGARAGVRARAAAPARHRRAGGLRRGRLRRAVGAGTGARAGVDRAGAPGGGADDRDAGGALPRAVRDHAGAARAARGGGRAGPRAARREPRRPHGVGRLLAARTASASSTSTGGR